MCWQNYHVVKCRGSTENIQHTYLLTYKLTYLLTYLFTAWSRVLLENLSGIQLVNKFTHFMVPDGSLPHLQVFLS